MVTDTTNLTDAVAASTVDAAIDADATASGYVVATSAGAVVTVTAPAGKLGNAVTLTSSSATGTATSSVARLTGGTSTTYSL